MQVSKVASVDLRNIAGETSVSNVPAVTGTHRAGDLTVSGAATVDLTLVSSRAKIRDVTQSIQLNARNGECAISNSTGTVAVTTANVELTIDHHQKGAIRVAGETGRVTLNSLGRAGSPSTRAGCGGSQARAGARRGHHGDHVRGTPARHDFRRRRARD